MCEKQWTWPGSPAPVPQYAHICTVSRGHGLMRVSAFLQLAPCRFSEKIKMMKSAEQSCRVTMIPRSDWSRLARVGPVCGSRNVKMVERSCSRFRFCSISCTDCVWLMFSGASDRCWSHEVVLKALSHHISTRLSAASSVEMIWWNEEVLIIICNVQIIMINTLILYAVMILEV